MDLDSLLWLQSPYHPPGSVPSHYCIAFLLTLFLPIFLLCAISIYPLCLITQLYPTLCNPMDCSPPGSSVHGDSQSKNTGGLPCPSPEDLPNPGIESRSPALQADSLPSEPPRKPMNTEFVSLFLLQGIFPNQEWNQGLLNGRQILYLLSYQGSPC